MKSLRTIHAAQMLSDIRRIVLDLDLMCAHAQEDETVNFNHLDLLNEACEVSGDLQLIVEELTTRLPGLFWIVSD
jgi:hypothetical protein